MLRSCRTLVTTAGRMQKSLPAAALEDTVVVDDRPPSLESKLFKVIEGHTTVLFPIEPYEAQRDVCRTFVKSLNKHQNAIIESPTGTGKTLALLSTVLAWISQHCMKRRDPSSNESIAENRHCAVCGSMFKASATEVSPIDNSDRQSCPKVFYATRTHKQMSQVILELSKTPYRDVKYTILSGRSELCINKKVMEADDILAECKKAVCLQNCQFHTGWKGEIKSSGTGSRFRRNLSLGHTWYPDDLRNSCRRQVICPYYTAVVSLLDDADLVICSYNYLFDPLLQVPLGLNLKLAKAIVIVDEAHNVENVCREALSVRMTHGNGRDACRALQLLLDKNVLENRDILGEDKTITSNDVKALWNFCDSFSNSLQSINDTNSASHETWNTQGENTAMMVHAPHTAARNKKALESLQIEQSTVPYLRQILMEVVSVFIRLQKRSSELYVPVNSLNLIGRLLLVADVAFKTKLTDFRLWIEEQDDGKTEKITLDISCMNPALAFAGLNNAQTVVLTSGTMTPFNNIEAELGVTFANKVIADPVCENVFTSYISHDSKNRELRFIHKSYQNEQLIKNLGSLVLDICTDVPDGVLCFVPNYAALESIENIWRASRIWSRIGRLKEIIIAGKSKSDSDSKRKRDRQWLKRYRNALLDGRKNGALLLAVHRSAASEGMDFKDKQSRAVISVGIPYPPIMDLKVLNKRSYNNQRTDLDGNDWYHSGTFRVLNQTLGRCIRHKDDWGALIMIDSRFGKSFFRKDLSHWISSSLRKTHNDDDDGCDWQKTRDQLKKFVHFNTTR